MCVESGQASLPSTLPPPPPVQQHKGFPPRRDHANEPIQRGLWYNLVKKFAGVTFFAFRNSIPRDALGGQGAEVRFPQTVANAVTAGWKSGLGGE